MSMVLRFSGSSNITATAIKIYTWDWASHVEAVIDNTTIPLAYGRFPAGKQLFGAHPDTGVNFRPLNSTDGDRVEEYTVEMSDATREAVLYHLLSQRGKPYDYIGIIGFAFHRDWRNDHTRWFCSEFQAWAFEKGLTPLLNTIDVNRLSPRDVRLSPLLKRSA